MKRFRFLFWLILLEVRKPFQTYLLNASPVKTLLFESFAEEHELEDQEQEDREQEDQEQEDQEQENQEQEDQKQEDNEQENQAQVDQELEDQEMEDQEQEDQEQENQELKDQEQENQELKDQEQEDQEQHGELVVNCSQRVKSPQDSKAQIDPGYMKESAVFDGDKDKEALVDEADIITDENCVSHVSVPVARPVDPSHLGELSANLTENFDKNYLAAGDMKERVLVKEDIPSGPRSPQSIPEITEGGDRGSSPILR